MPFNYTIQNHITQPYYTEGPVLDKDGNIFFTTLSGGSIMKKNIAGLVNVWATSACPNGQLILDNGHHLVCDSKLSSIVQFDREGHYIGNLVHAQCGGQPIHVPNDLTMDSKGNIYFTDSVRHKGKVGYISAEGEERIIAGGLDYPNGLALSTDESLLYVAESYKNRIIAIRLPAHQEYKAPGQKAFAWLINLPCHPSGIPAMNLPDGIKVDANDNLWIAHYGMGMVHVVSPGNALIQSIKTPFPLTSNLFLKNNTVIVTGGEAEPGPGAVLEITIHHD